MSAVTEVWIDCDKADCDERVGPCLTEASALIIAIRAKWLPMTTLRGGREVLQHWCPTCRKAMPPR